VNEGTTEVPSSLEIINMRDEYASVGLLRETISGGVREYFGVTFANNFFLVPRFLSARLLCSFRHLGEKKKGTCMSSWAC
jgi:hypothetical protein